jgi:hypothetical protein
MEPPPSSKLLDLTMTPDMPYVGGSREQELDAWQIDRLLGKWDLRRLLTDSKMEELELEQVLLNFFDPADSYKKEITIGDEEEHSPNTIRSAIALKKFLEHIQKNGSFFPKLRFVNCDFTPESYQVLITSLSKLQFLQGLTFENCALNSEKLVELLSCLITLDKNFLALTITRNKFAFDAQVMECFEVLLQIPHSLTTLTLDNNGLKEPQILCLAAYLKDNQNLREISLNGNSVTMKSALALAEWVKTHPNVRMCRLVFTGLTPANQAELDRQIGRKPSPFVFLPAPPPQASQPGNNPLLHIIKTAKRYEASQWDLLATITDLSIKRSYFKLWLKLGFHIFDAQETVGAMSFFSVLALGCNRNSTKGEEFLRLTIVHIANNIHEFTESIVMDFPHIPEEMNLMDFLVREVYEKGSWLENTFRLAIPKVLHKLGVHRPIYLFTPTIKPIITDAGELLPNPSLCFFDTAQDLSSILIDSPIYIYYDGGNQFSLITKKSGKSGPTP